jgi:hypothetical protein
MLRQVRPLCTCASGQRLIGCLQFYSFVLIGFADISLVVLLDDYACPKPVVADLVRDQLLSLEETNRILRALDNLQRDLGRQESIYDLWLPYAGLDYGTQSSAIGDAIDRHVLPYALFDLTLGQQVKAFEMSRYTEVHDVRDLFWSFFLAWRDCIADLPQSDSIWWDEASGIQAPHHEPWLSQAMKDNQGAFLPIFESWSQDSKGLQTWLSSMEEGGLLANNPTDRDRVFSESVAVEIIKWATVRRLNTGSASSHSLRLIQYQANVLDSRRRTLFDSLPKWVLKECHKLALFDTRLPQFSQLFFHDFSAGEIAARSGQISLSTASLHAAKGYLKSWITLESTCGISSIWYNYVQVHWPLLLNDKRTGKPPVNLSYPGKFDGVVREWEKIHNRPQPTKKTPVSGPSTKGSPSKESQPNKSAENSTSTRISTSEQEEAISQFTEDLETVDPIEPPSSKVKDEFSSFEMEEWSASFQEDYFNLLDEYDIAEIPPVVTDDFMPSSVPEERELCRGPTKTVTAEVEDEDQMEGVELSQLTRDQVDTDAVGSSDDESVAGEDKMTDEDSEEMMDEDDEETADEDDEETADEDDEKMVDEDGEEMVDEGGGEVTDKGSLYASEGERIEQHFD